MPASRYRLLRILAGLMIFLLGCPPPSTPPREVILQGIATLGEAGFTLLGEVFFLTPNSTGSFLLQVRDPDTGDPVPNGTVTVSLSDPDGDTTRVFRGTTDDQEANARIGNGEPAAGHPGLDVAQRTRG